MGNYDVLGLWIYMGSWRRSRIHPMIEVGRFAEHCLTAQWFREPPSFHGLPPLQVSFCQGRTKMFWVCSWCVKCARSQRLIFQSHVRKKLLTCKFFAPLACCCCNRFSSMSCPHTVSMAIFQMLLDALAHFTGTGLTRVGNSPCSLRLRQWIALQTTDTGLF